MEAKEPIRITSQATGIVIYRVDEDGTVYFAVMDYTIVDHTKDQRYTRGQRTTLRLPLETGGDIKNGKVKDGKIESVESTIKRLLKEEIGNGAIKLLTAMIAYAALRPDEKMAGTHLKIFFAIEAEGELRDYETRDTSPAGREIILGPMKWIEVGQVVNVMKGVRSPTDHLLATYGALAVLARDRKVFDRYERLLSGCELPQLAPEDKKALEGYLGRSLEKYLEHLKAEINTHRAE